jgi:hypothetical protein
MLTFYFLFFIFLFFIFLFFLFPFSFFLFPFSFAFLIFNFNYFFETFVKVNARFAITQDRTNICGEEKSEKADWNAALLSNIIPETYLTKIIFHGTIRMKDV